MEDMEDKDPNEDIEISSTETQLKTFKESSIWADMKRELELWMLMLQGSYDKCDSLAELKLIQGRREAVVHLLALPDNLMHAAKTQREKDKEERNERRV